MTTTQWVITAVIALLGGGAMGAVITTYVSYKRNKRQPVTYTMEIIDIFRKGQNFPRLAKLMVTEHPLGFGEERSVNNLSLARIKVTNRGNQDIPKFTFGVTMDDANKTVDTRFSGIDRHHVITMDLPDFDFDKEPKGPIKAIDFNMEPFNRGDTYKVDIYFTYEGKRGRIRLSSPHSTELVEAKDSTGKLRTYTREYFVLGVGLAATAVFIFAFIDLLGSRPSRRERYPERPTIEQLQESNRQLREAVQALEKKLANPPPTPTQSPVTQPSK